jgi:hypothetical protein
MTSTQDLDQTQPRKLVLKKETLRQLTNRDLQRVAGGVLSGTLCQSGTPTVSSYAATCR